MRRSLAIALAVNLICAIALLWSTTQRLHVTIVDSGTSVTGIVGSTRVTAPTDGATGGQIGLFLQGADPQATVYWPAAPSSSDQPARSSASQWLYRLAAESGWTNVQVTDLGAGPTASTSGSAVQTVTAWRPRSGDWFPHLFGGETTPDPGLITSDVTTGPRFRLDADLLRPRDAAGILVLSPNGVDGLLFYFRPEDRDAMWFRVQSGTWGNPIASAPFHTFKQGAVASIQDVIRLALGGFPGALGIILAALAFGALEAKVAERIGNRAASTDDEQTAAEHSVARGLVPRSAGQAEDKPPRYGGSSDGDCARASPWPFRVSWLSFRAAATNLRPGIPAPRDSSLAALGMTDLGMRGDQSAAGGIAVIPDNVEHSDARGLLHFLPTIAALVLVGIALVSTLDVADAVLQRMPHVQDSVAYLFQAKTFALGRLWAPLPTHPQFFQEEFIVMDNGRWFSKYPPGWPMVLALGVLAKAPWVVDPICGALSVFVVYRLGAEIYRPRVGLLAAALVVASPFFLFLSGSMMSHTSGLLFTLLFAWGFWRATRSERPVVPGALSGAALGMAFLIRPYSALLIAIPFVLYALWEVWRRPEANVRRYAPVAVAAAPFLIAFLAYNAYFTGSPFYPPQQLWWPFDRVGFGPGHGPWGFTPIDGLNNTSQNLQLLITHTFGWPTFLTLSFAMVPFLIGRVRKWDWLWLLGFGALVGGYGLWWANGIMYGPRFYFEGLGFLTLLTARGIDEVLSLASRGVTRTAVGQSPSATVTSGLVYAFVAGLIAFNLVVYFPVQWQLYHGYNYTNRGKLDAVERAGIHHALVFADVGPQYAWWEYGMVFSANDPLLRGDVIFARDLGTAADRTLMADFPGRSYYRLNGTQLTPMGGSATPGT